MFIIIDNIYLRKIEKKDLPHYYIYKNDPEINSLLGGFTTGLSLEDIDEWYEYHRNKKDELLLSIIDKESDNCIGHVGLYNIDYRIRSAEFAIMIGEKLLWNKGIGKICTKYIIEYGFNELNLNRIYLSLLDENNRAFKLYSSIGFTKEGYQRSAQYKNGKYQNVILMGLLKEEYIDK